jgi:hypothetical protein
MQEVERWTALCGRLDTEMSRDKSYILTLEEKVRGLEASLKATLESHDQTVKELMTEYTKVIDGLKKGEE